MKYFFFLLICTAGLHGVSFCQTGHAKEEKVRHLKTGTGLEFGLWGGNGEKSPAPLLFILSSTIDESLGSEYFRQCGNRLAREHGWLCVSLDLPYHGQLQKDTAEAMLVGWAKAVKRKEDFITANNRRMKEILQYLIAKGYADPANIFACGSSRGGYLALQFAAAEPAVRSVAAFGPVTDLTALREFKNISKKDVPPVYDLYRQLDALAVKRIWIVTGDRDERVGTDLTVAFARKLSRRMLTASPAGRVELNVMWEPRGHTTPAGSVDRAVDWLLQSFTPGKQ